ncbi:MAG: tRNA pseudouridine(55) synthase TruB [Chloroflexi bacterium]|jgi:tRNA pseudouridine55 synthase|nr:tRNA pseudouridine(55) synthase TruB [Chloroflexota bacterium]
MDDRRTQLKNSVSGVLVVDKPIGITSHDVVQIIRNGTRIKRAGHTGTLDPRASGVLVILLGPAVRLSEYVSAEDKRYHAVIQLGKKTDTFDEEGTVTGGTSPEDITAQQFDEALQGFVGEIEQVPPPYSAVKVNGRKAYEMARKGEEVELEPRIIHVHDLELLEWDPPQALVDVHCSSGTYVRSLANDLGEVLGCGAMLAGLRRTKSGKFTLKDAISLRKLTEAFQDGTWYKYLIPAADALGEWPTINLTDEEVDLVRHGHRVKREENIGDMTRAISEQGELVALMQFDSESGEYQPKKVFFS